MFYNIHPTESISQLIWKEGLSSSDLRAQVEGKDRLRNDTLFLQDVKDGGYLWGGEAGVAQAQDAIKGYVTEPKLLQAQAKWLSNANKVANLWKRRVFQHHSLGSGAEAGWYADSIRTTENS